MSKFASTFQKVLEKDTIGVIAQPIELKKKINDKTELNADTSSTDAKEEKIIKVETIKVEPKKPLKEYVDPENPPHGPYTPQPEQHSQGEPSDEEVWKKSLDKGTNPNDFATADNPQIKIDHSGIEAARHWITKLEEMAEFVNGTSPESLNYKINELEVKNSIPFRGVVRREEKRITKIAENLRGLAEVFKTVVTSSHKKIKDSTTPR